MSSAVGYHFTIPEIPDKSYLEDPAKYVITELVPALKKACEKVGLERDTSMHDVGNLLLVAFMSNIFYIGEEFGVVSSMDGYDAIGSGREVALGAMYVARSNGMEDYNVMHMGLSAAEHLTAYVKKPFEIKIYTAPPIR